ncbi:hypothetical protein INS49_010966 [Diaporthe citri]|uniref:uncharacterized protein n=1 Tax=Diaporthe citri TaxID=83186 RepID=UPI001C80E9F5|nr:uncharacterized protein INS49_010966 [Diaporthe citri]KAG6359913.1 hypothetical protein INS49_010966 [Diaporthe citri]
MSSEEHAKADRRESGDTSATPPSEFKKFGDFPQELQDLIWHTAVLSVPRFHIVRAHITCIDSGIKDPWISINPCEEVKQRTRRLRPLLLACKKARKEVLRTLPPPLRFASFFGVSQKLQTGQIHFDVEADVLCIVPPFNVCRGGPMAPGIWEGFRRIKNLGVQVNFAMAPNRILSSLVRDWSLRVSIPSDSLFCLRAFTAAARFYIVAPPHVRKAPKPPKYHEGSFGNRLKESQGDTHAADDELEVGYMSHGSMWSNNPVLRSLQMTATPGFFGTTGQFGFTKVPVQQIQHVYVTDSGQDLTPTLLSLWLSLCCRPDTYNNVRKAIWHSFKFPLAQIGGHVMGILQEPGNMMQYCGVLLPMVETYPLLKVYNAPVRG